MLLLIENEKDWKIATKADNKENMLYDQNPKFAIIFPLNKDLKHLLRKENQTIMENDCINKITH